MRQLSPLLSTLTNSLRTPLRPILNNANITPSTISPGLGLNLGSSSPRPFSTTPTLLKKKVVSKPDRRVTLIRYFLHHPKTPRPLRFSRNRYLRHWTIHRAWHLYQARRRKAHENDLQRQWQAMGAACEELRTGAGDGGKLFRVAMNKKGVYTDLFPIEYGRMQTEWPSWGGWDHEWKRPGGK